MTSNHRIEDTGEEPYNPAIQVDRIKTMSDKFDWSWALFKKETIVVLTKETGDLQGEAIEFL